MLELKFDSQPSDFLKKCEDELFERISVQCRKLQENPVPQNAIRVKGCSEPTFRIRIGKYRALYRINHPENRIVVIKIDHRETVY